ncbi:MAG: carbohydrate kinase family protein [Candidatus Chisholmbacteria bacterium]|nr:carbohydrate kinase family protein [Candidatus Chisholmbacteria bacterium]
MFDLISVGDNTIDVFLEIDRDEVRIKDENKDKVLDLIMDFGAKIPVKKVTRIAAVGNAANNAIGSARLGLKTAIYTVVGDDRDSQDTVEVFKKEGVALDHVVTQKGSKSNFSVVVNVGTERTILVYHEKRNYNLPELGEARWVYYTSVGKGHEILHEQISAYSRKSGAKLAFQPGSYQLREGREGLKNILESTEVLLLNKEEAAEILGRKAEIAEMARGLTNLGPKIAVVTDGRKGSWTYDGAVMRMMGIIPEKEEVERTGAGDAYSTAFVAALILGEGVSEAMRWGSANASSVVEHIGAREGLLTREGIEERLRSCPECKVEER